MPRAAYEGEYIVRLRQGSSVADVVRALNHLEGVQNVAMERHEPVEV